MKRTELTTTRMRNNIQYYGIFLVWSVFCLASASPRKTNGQSSATTWTDGPGCASLAELNAAVDETIAGKEPIANLGVYIEDPDCGVFSRMFGYADFVKKRPFTESTPASIGSATWAISAALLLEQIVECPSCFPSGVDTSLVDVRDRNGSPIFQEPDIYVKNNGELISVSHPEAYPDFDCQAVNMCVILSETTILELLQLKSGFITSLDYFSQPSTIAANFNA